LPMGALYNCLPLDMFAETALYGCVRNERVEGDFMGEPKTSARRAVFRMLGTPILMAACGCAGGVHLVSQSPEGGVIAIPTNSDQWPTHYRSRAERLMEQTCPTGYVIDHEEIVVEKPARSGKEAPNDDEYYEYNGALQKISNYRRETYRITFHAAPPEGRRPKTDVPPQAGKTNSSTLPPSPPSGVDKDELPPPRPLKATQE